jgi:hypothetical protein
LQKLVKIAVVLLIVCCAGLADAASRTLAWDPPIDWTPEGYIIFVGTAPREYTYHFNLGATTSYTFDPIPEGATYYVAVAGYDAYGVVGNLSEELTVEIPFSAPAAMTDLVLAPHVPSPQAVGIAVIWLANASGGVTPHQYQWAFFESDEWTVGPWTSDSSTTWTPPTPGEYLIRVRVRSAGSTSIAGEMVKTVPFTVTEDAQTRPLPSRRVPPAGW